MGILEGVRRPKPAGSGRWIVIPRTQNAQSRRRSRVIRRRRQNFVRLLAFAGAALILTFVPHLHWLLWAQVAADVALVVYVWRLLEYKKRERQRAAVVTELPADDPHSIVDPGVGARRIAGSG